MMTAAEAAKACMASIAKCIEDGYALRSDEQDEVEREFTEIISQVTRGTLSDRLPVIAVREQMQQARCPRCDCPLGGKHQDNCSYPLFESRLMQNQAAAYSPADLCNANPYREIAPPLVPVQPMPTPELLMRGTAPPFDTSGLSEQGRFPQEIEEPRSDTRGRGPFREDYFSLCSRHQVTDWNCHICQNGYWVNRVRMTEDEATREHLFGANVKETE